MSDYYSESVADMPLFRRTDPATSKIAGTMAREFRGDHERKILEALAAGPGWWRRRARPGRQQAGDRSGCGKQRRRLVDVPPRMLKRTAAKEASR